MRVDLISLLLQVALIIDNAISPSLEQETQEFDFDSAKTDDTAFLDNKLKARAEHYTFSPAKLISLAELEQDVYSILLEFNKTTSDDLQMDKTVAEDVNAFLIDYKEGALEPTADIAPLTRQTRAYEVAANPLMAFRMLRRFSLYLPSVAAYIPLEVAPSSCVWCTKLRSALADVNLPTEDDASDAMDSILRMQMYYNFTSADLWKGIFGSVDTKGSLTSLNVWELGLHAKYIKNFVLAVEWLELGLRIVNTIPDYNEKYEELIMKDLKESKTEHDASWEDQHNSPNRTREYLTLFKDKFAELPDGYGYKYNADNEKGPENGRVRIIDTVKEHESPLPLEIYSRPDWEVSTMMRYMSLCSGKNYQSAEEKRQLHCWYERESNPYWKINPLKMELLHPEPRLVQVYNLLGHELLDEINAQGIPLLKMAETVSISTEENEVSDYRTAVNAWIYDRSTFQKESFYKKLKFFTGLNVREENESEVIQLAAYSFGGQYAPHIDCFGIESYIEDHGERIATFMTYMSDVKAGGFTAFPFLGTSAVPVKGSAVFWYDTFKNGSCDGRLVHGACPVILDHKYVFNIWIRSHTNFLQSPCDLDKFK